MAELKTYDPKQVSVIVGGSIIKSWNTVTAARDNESWMMTTGTQGESTRTKNANKMGAITLVLPQASDDNAILSAYEISGAQISISIIDKSGISLHSMPEGTVTKTPDAEYGNEAGEREWIIRGDLPIHVPGGNPVTV